MTYSDLAASYEGAIFSERAQKLMIQGNILNNSATPGSLISGLLIRLADAERLMGEAPGSTENAMARLYDYLQSGRCILGTPLLTNIAARHGTLASCTAVPIRAADLSDSALSLAADYYKLNMGSGYDLTTNEDPVGALKSLNEHASKIDSSDTCERYVGNIAHVSVSHPRISEFISAKVHHDGIVHFNTSVDVSESFMEAVAQDTDFERFDGTRFEARRLWDEIVRCAWQCGDPGIVSMERFNAGNSLNTLSPYVTMAPCAEVGLAPGESCVFGYINLAACLKPTSMHLDLDLDLVGDIAESLTRILDDALECSVSGYPTQLSRNTMNSNRKIGIGICGYADALMWIGLDYGAAEGRDLLARALSTINYRSKLASMNLAKRRSEFPLFRASRFVNDRGFLARFSKSSVGVQESEWHELETDVARHGLRNSMTTALPPSGRSALILGVNPSLEPFLTLQTGDDYVLPVHVRIAEGLVGLGADRRPALTRASGGDWPRRSADAHSLFRTATELHYSEHLETLRVAAELVDDGVSKTINMPCTASQSDVDSAFTQAWQYGLKAISVYIARS